MAGGADRLVTAERVPPSIAGALNTRSAPEDALLALSEEQVGEYQSDGFTIAHDLIYPVLREYEQVLDIASNLLLRSRVFELNAAISHQILR